MVTEQTMPAVKIICFATEDWNTSGKRVQHVMQELARWSDIRSILYVNPPISFSLKDAMQRRFRPGWSELPRELYGKALLGLARPIDDTIVTYTGSDMLLPLSRWGAVRQSGILQRLNERIYLSRIRAHARGRPGEITIVWASHALHASLARRISRRDLLIYDWMDDWEQFELLPTETAAELRVMNDWLVRQADLVFAVSENLYRRAHCLNANALLVPNGTHDQHFRTSARASQPDLERIRPPRLGYTGRIGDRVDFDLLEQVARTKPEWSIVLVGPIWENAREQCRRLQALPNLHFLGPRPYQDLPGIISELDVCLIPHTIDPLTASMDPIKLYDYLATGKPVVTTRVAGVERFLDAIYVADSSQQFVSRVTTALLENDGSAIERRRAYARQNSWEARAAVIRSAIEARLAVGDSGSDSRSLGVAG
ncbi:MAG TPA: glycosyltransferase [Chloroflexota bacterium]|nr:glycosyltransferase [Chloroflexota bacterium]